MITYVDGKKFNWDINLRGDEVEKFQWCVNLVRIVDEEDNHRIYEVANRGWRAVGPEFNTRKEGSRYLGFDGSSGKEKENMVALIAEYNSLYSDEIETHEQFHPENTPKFGRPSQGRTERMQYSATPELKKWIESQIKPGENVSAVTFRLLEMLMNGSKDNK